jgi:DNA mismatch repair ATPase MutS
LRKISREFSVKSPKKKLQKNLPYNIIPLDSSNIVNNAKEIEDAALVHILRAINQFTSSILHFFEALHFETGFYVGCINLHIALSEVGAPVSFPTPLDIDRTTLEFTELYDADMAVNTGKTPVTNSLHAPGKSLFIITGANQGGKSTFLRSIGLAQLLMQCGAFVPAAAYRSNVVDSIFTHFTREEDVEMNSGKLDEELSRMNDIVNRITPRSLVLMNEPFATTTEREGSKIALDIASAFRESGIKVLFVTHLFEFSSCMHNLGLEDAMFLRAERNADGSRSFSIKEGKPLRTSYGEDLFAEITGAVIKTPDPQLPFEETRFAGV